MAPALLRERGGWVASGPGFYVWEEEEASARGWLEALTEGRPSRPSPRPTPSPAKRPEACPWTG
jgi:hypothetical protein